MTQPKLVLNEEDGIYDIVPFINAPGRVHEIVEMAIDGMHKVETDPNSIICMGSWHSGTRQFRNPNRIDEMMTFPCEVCMGGSLMREVFGLGSDASISPDKIRSTEWREAIELMDSLRCGVFDDIVLFREFDDDADKLNTLDCIGVLKRSWREADAPEYDTETPGDPVFYHFMSKVCDILKEYDV